MTDYPSFKIDFLGCNVCLILEKEWLKAAGKILKKDLLSDDRFLGVNAIAFAQGRSYYIAALPSVKDTTLYHECFHVVMEIVADFELGFSHEQHEISAYLIEYIIENVLRLKKQRRLNGLNISTGKTCRSA